MRKVRIAVLFCISVLAFFPKGVNSQHVMPAYLEGKITDAETGEPLRGAHVFLSGTKIGAVTNTGGRYFIRRIPPGSYRLAVSIIGYERNSEEIVLLAGENKTVDIKLNTIVYELDEIYAGNLDSRWSRYLNRFERLFLGESTLADSVKILNPEVLRFESRWWGRFTAEALAPLQIENYALGYRITYYLDEFRHTGLRTQWTGDSHFEEMFPEDSAQAAYWKENRLNAFKGSLRHFLISLMNQNVSEEGFIVYHLRQDIRGNYRRNTFRVNPAQIIREAEDDHFYHLQFRGRIEIIYTLQNEDVRYARWARNIQQGRSSVQTSYLQLNQRPITVDPNGGIVETYGATRFGYYSFQRVAEEIPKEYRVLASDEDSW